ncbi:TetR/AcrR family transcriptional regulator [Phenylobacterium sp. LjRoot219]|uniref:TetR/AcrR family transcriptional regulator n=1 Tax=Phenylobacterium sp. LjRoot219 TaxID=3342283 RepID=UPI003ED0452E
MTRRQKVGLESSATRIALLDAAELLMREEGYAAVTSRRIGATAGVKPQLVHYYFRTMDDLFIALFQRRAERGVEAAAQAMESDTPLRALWDQSRDPTDVAMNLEFMALANHRKALRVEMGLFGERLRKIQQDALARHFQRRGIDPQISPGVVTLIMAGVGSVLVLEATINMSNAHEATEALVEDYLRRFEAAEAVLPQIKPRAPTAG